MPGTVCISCATAGAALATYDVLARQSLELGVDPKHPLRPIMIASFIFNVIRAILLPKLPVALTHGGCSSHAHVVPQNVLFSVTCCLH
jgi:hypothetical protein